MSKYYYKEIPYFMPPIKDFDTDSNKTETFKESEHMYDSLYEFEYNGKTTYGTFLTVNSRGEAVIEVKGSGEVISISQDLIKEVVPLTASVTFWGQKQQYTYMIKEGQVKEGQIIVMESPSGPAIVTVQSVKQTKGNWKQLKVLAVIYDGESE